MIVLSLLSSHLQKPEQSMLLQDNEYSIWLVEKSLPQCVIIYAVGQALIFGGRVHQSIQIQKTPYFNVESVGRAASHVMSRDKAAILSTLYWE